MKRKIYIIFHGRYPSEKAASLFSAMSAESFSELGQEVHLLVPRRFGRSSSSAGQYYGIKEDFKTHYLPTIDIFPVPLINNFAFVISNITFSLFCLLYLLIKADKRDIIYSNEALPLLVVSFFFSRTFYEMHDFPEKKIQIYGFLYKSLRALLITNKWKIESVKDKFAIPASKILYEPNAVDISMFNIMTSKKEARIALGLPEKSQLVVYTGHLYSWKGVDTLVSSASMIPEVRVFLVGGTDSDIAKYREMYKEIKNLFIAGHRPHQEIPLWQRAADILILPNTGKENISKYYTSPMKLFEYMASKTPIIASRIPSITEILNDDNSLLVEPDSPTELATAINKIMCDNSLGKKYSEQAFADVRKHSWNERAKRILGFLNEVM